jgi:hypothetical protein
MKQIFTFTLLILAIGLAAFEYDVIDELAMGGDLSDCLSLQIDYPYMYAASRYGLEVYEIDSLTGALTKLAVLAITEHADSIVKRGNFVYLLKNNMSDDNSPEPSMLFKISVTNPAEPVIENMMNIDLPQNSYASKLRAFDTVLWYCNVINHVQTSISLVDPVTLECIATVEDYYGFHPLQNDQAIAMVNIPDQLYTIYDFSDPLEYHEVCIVTLDQTEEYGGHFYPLDDTHVIQINDAILLIYDTTDLMNWQLVGSTTQTELSAMATVSSVVGDYLFVPKDLGIEVFNCADPSAPFSTGFFAVDPSYYYPLFMNNCNVVNWENHIYWGSIFDGIFHYSFENEHLNLIDNYCPEYVLNAFPIKNEQDYFTISTGGGLDTFSIEDGSILHNCRVLTDHLFYTLNHHGFYEAGYYYINNNSYLGLFNLEDGVLSQVVAFPLAEGEYCYLNPTEPTAMYTIDTFSQTISKYSFDDPNNVQELWQISVSGILFNLTFVGDSVYARSTNQLHVFRGFNANTPEYITTIYNPFNMDNFYLQCIDEMLVIQDDEFVNFYSAQDPEVLELICSINVNEYVYLARKHDSFLYVPENYSLHVYDISDYDNPVHLGYIPLNSHYQDIVFYEENGVEKAIIQQAECLTMVTIQPTETGEPTLPVVECTLGNYPNPFNPSTEIRFQMSDASQLEHAQIEIFNIRGQKVKELKADMSSRPQRRDLSYSTTWDGCDSNGTPVAGGVYLYQLKADGKALGQSKMLLLK